MSYVVTSRSLILDCWTRNGNGYRNCRRAQPGQPGTRRSTAYPALEASGLNFTSMAALSSTPRGGFRSQGIGIGRPWLIQQSSELPFAARGAFFRWLPCHTHDGIIHIESPFQLTLVDFFATWGEPASSIEVDGVEGPALPLLNARMAIRATWPCRRTI